MTGFEYHTPTRVIFGRDAISNLPDVMREYGNKVLFVYGCGSIKKSGLYDKVISLLEEFEVFELPGVEPNPKFDPSVVEGARICKENGVDAILAVGGGSVIDCAKAISGCALYDGDLWELVSGEAETLRALPVIDVLTLAATGSEFDNDAVISKTDSNDKLSYMNDFMYPAVSILDPSYTCSVSRRQTVAGTIDAINHFIERYFCAEHSMLTDGLIEAAVRTLIVKGEAAINDPDDLDARSELMAACMFGCNDILSVGNSDSGWPCHAIEHALSAYFDINHGEGLAAITPRWMEKILSPGTAERFISFGKGVFGITDNGDPVMALAKKTIYKLIDLFESWGVPMYLSDLGVTDDKLEEIAEHIDEKEGLENAWVPLSRKDVLDILVESM